MSRDLPTVDLLGQPFHALTEAAVVDHVLSERAAGRGGWIVTPNLDILRQLTESAALRALIAEASLVVADGMPLIWASRFQATALPERVAGSSLISGLSREAARAGRSVYLLGGEPGSARGAARALQRSYPGLRIAGTDCPPIGFDADEARLEAISERLAEAAPDIVYLGLGFPKQERVIARLRDRLPGAWWMGVGISFSYLSGHVRRAPRWIRRSGLEWGFRLAQEPGRLTERYLRHDLPFALRLFAASLVRRRPSLGDPMGSP